MRHQSVILLSRYIVLCAYIMSFKMVRQFTHFELKVVRGDISECWHTGKDLKVLRGNDYRPYRLVSLVSKVLPLYQLVP